MMLRKLTFAGLMVALAAPAFTYAASSGLTIYDIEQGQTQLLSSRARPPEKVRQAKATSAREKATISDEQARHLEAMETGAIRMTTGSMEGAPKQ